MKKIILALFLILSASNIYSSDISFLKSEGKSDKNISLDSVNRKLEGRAKLGLSLGTVSGITFGYQLTKLMELNAAVDIFNPGNFSGSVNALFAVFDLEAGEAVFPVSAGPAVVFKGGNNEKTDLLGILRIEYDFSSIHLNLFLEGGAGLKLIPEIDFTGAGSLGLRYIF